jgi:hypothetical protein
MSLTAFLMPGGQHAAAAFEGWFAGGAVDCSAKTAGERR